MKLWQQSEFRRLGASAHRQIVGEKHRSADRFFRYAGGRTESRCRILCLAEQKRVAGLRSHAPCNQARIGSLLIVSPLRAIGRRRGFVPRRRNPLALTCVLAWRPYYRLHEECRPGPALRTQAQAGDTPRPASASSARRKSSSTPATPPAASTRPRSSAAESAARLRPASKRNQLSLGQSQAAPRTPLESPCRAGTIGV